MTTETLFAGETPDTDSNDPGTKHTYGMRFTSTVDGTVSTGRIWCPNPKPPTMLWLLFRTSDQALLASVDLSAATLTAGTWNPVDPSDVSVVASTQYVVAARYEGGHQVVSTTGVSFPLSHSTHLSVDTGVFKLDGASTDYPGSTFALYAFADVDFVAGSATTNAPAEASTGTGAANSPAISVSAAAESAASTGTAYDALVGGAVAAESISGSGLALDALAGIGAVSGLPTGVGSAFDAAVSLTVDAGLPVATGLALDVSFMATAVRATASTSVVAQRTSTAGVSARRTSDPTVTGG